MKYQILEKEVEIFVTAKVYTWQKKEFYNIGKNWLLVDNKCLLCFNATQSEGTFSIKPCSVQISEWFSGVCWSRFQL